MTISADDAVSTLRFLVPGFVLLSVFYWFGLATKRTDWRWLLWSLIASVPIGWLAGWIAELVGDKPDDLASAVAQCGVELVTDEPTRSALRAGIEECVSSALSAHNQDWRFLISLVIAVIGGLVAVWAWRRLAIAVPALRKRTEPLVWGSVLRDQRWLKVWLEADVFVGYTREVADPVLVDAADLDLYLGEPMASTDNGQTFERMENVEGIILRRDDIKRIEVFEPQGDPPNRDAHIHLTLGERLRGWITAERAAGRGS